MSALSIVCCNVRLALAFDIVKSLVQIALSLHRAWPRLLIERTVLLLLDEMLYVYIVRLKVFYLSEAAFLFDSRDVLVYSCTLLWGRIFALQLQNRTINCLRKCIKSSRVWHAELQSFLDRSFH